MKLNIFFGVIVLYILLAFTWLTFSLIDFTNREYKLKNQILKAGREACMLKVIEKAKSGGFKGENNGIYNLRQIEIEIDTNNLNKYLQSEYFGSFESNFTQIIGKNILSIEVSAKQKEELKKERTNNTRFYIIEALVLTILVAAGIFGVYYGVNFLYDLNKQQNNFLLSVTHEFKTPLAAIKLMLQTIVARNLDKEKAMGLLHNAIENTDRLNELTENMLTAMQIENDRYSYAYDLFSISNMMEEIADHFELKGDIERNIEGNIDLGGDEFILKITVNNLIENAFKYAGDGPVSLRLYKQKQQCIIEISDQGPGIPNKHKKKVFKKFYRIEEEETRNTKGTGLGLYIAKQAISKHGGEIKIVDNIPHGTTFQIILPIKK